MFRFVPMALTYINLICGFVIICISMIDLDIYIVSCLRIIALIVDVFDGRVARKLNVTSELGMYLDSFADIVTFGIAPAFSILAYSLVTGSLVYVISLVGVAIVYICSSAYRLARFHTLQANTSTTANTHYIGMPITVNGILFPLTLSICTLVSGNNHLVFFIGMSIYMILSAYLMASTIRFPKL